MGARLVVRVPPGQRTACFDGRAPTAHRLREFMVPVVGGSSTRCSSRVFGLNCRLIRPKGLLILRELTVNCHW